MLDKNNFKEELLQDLNVLIKDTFNLDLEFICKDMDEGYTEAVINNNQIEAIDVDKVVDLLNEKLSADCYYKNFEPNKYVIHKKSLV